jgi:hypothetical protein
MSRRTIEIDQKKLTEILNRLESEQTFTNRSALFEEAAKEYGEPSTSAIVYLRVKQWNIELKTVKAKPGEHLKGGNAEALKAFREDGDQKPKKIKGDSTPFIKYFTTEEKGKLLKLAKSVKRGSLKAAIKLKCLDCCNFDRKEVKYCACPECPLWLVRPFQPTMEDYLANSEPEVQKAFDKS